MHGQDEIRGHPGKPAWVIRIVSAIHDRAILAAAVRRPQLKTVAVDFKHCRGAFEPRRGRTPRGTPRKMGVGSARREINPDTREVVNVGPGQNP